MNRELNLIAIDRESIIWKQNHSSGGSSMVQSEPECLTHGGCCETPPPPLPRGSATPSKCGAANNEADPGPPTSTLTVHPILDLHELMNCRLEHLAVIQAEILSEFARLVEARNNLCRQTELCRSFLETGQMPFEGQQRLDRVVQRREQLAAVQTQRASTQIGRSRQGNGSPLPCNAAVPKGPAFCFLNYWSHSTTG